MGSNGLAVGMNRSSLEAFEQRTGLTDEALGAFASWPIRREEHREEHPEEPGVAEGQNADE